MNYPKNSRTAQGSVRCQKEYGRSRGKNETSK